MSVSIGVAVNFILQSIVARPRKRCQAIADGFRARRNFGDDGTAMTFPFDYEHGAPLQYGGAMPTMKSFDDSRVVILPVPVDRTTSYVSGTRNGPREILEASSHMELWDEEVGADVHDVGIFTLPADGAARSARWRP